MTKDLVIHPNPGITFALFYDNIQLFFPGIERLLVWQELDWKDEPALHSTILSEVAREMIRWGQAGNWKDVERLLVMVEEGLKHGVSDVQAYLGTDFTVTITECDDRPVREKIKAMFLPETTEAYQINLRGYREPN
ncbi:MAG: hypothetical protein JNM31_09235 [Flavobacteriales bacterium]|nr:hypothetical protein [Flavobacteriales bacterium]